MNIECLQIAQKATFAQIIKQKKGGQLYQLYKVDINKRVKIGGAGDNGYCLNFHIGRPSNLVLTDLEILKLLHGDILEINGQNWSKV